MSEEAESIDKIDKNKQSANGLLITELSTYYLQYLKNNGLKEKINNFYLQHPIVFISSLIILASILVPFTVIISIVLIHVVIGTIACIIIEAIILLSSAAVVSFMFFLIVSAMTMTGISIIVIYLSTYWFATKLKHYRQNFIYDLLAN